MSHVAEWKTSVYLFEEGDGTKARIVLDTASNTLTGEGSARRNPVDPDVPEIGDELAVGRAFIDLGNRLVGLATEDLAEFGNH